MTTTLVMGGVLARIRLKPEPEVLYVISPRIMVGVDQQEVGGTGLCGWVFLSLNHILSC